MNSITKTEHAAILNSSQHIVVPFSNLRLSERYQARKLTDTERRQLPAVHQLAASIVALGILQNLVVIASDEEGVYEVCAGGNRLAAIGLCVSNGQMPDGFPVPCLLIDAEHAHHASLIENMARSAMHPADVYESYARLRSSGMTVGEIAAAHGAAETAVRKLLALADVAPSLMSEFRSDRITLAEMQALASVADHSRQVAAWAAVSENYDYYANKSAILRRSLAENEASSKSALARFVSVEAYQLAGGTIREDLFSVDERSEVYLEQPALLQTLALEKLKQSLLYTSNVADGWGWVECRVSFSHDDRKEFGEIKRIRREPNDSEQQQIADLKATIDGLQDKMNALEDSDDCDDAALSELDTEHSHHIALLEDLEDSLCSYAPEFKALAGTVIYIDYDGRIECSKGLVRRDDVSAVRELMGDTQNSRRDAAGADLSNIKLRPIHSESLLQQLSAHKTALVRAALGERPDVAIAWLAAKFGEQLLGRFRNSGQVGISLTDGTYDIDRAAPDFKGSAAEAAISAQWAEWQRQMPTNKHGEVQSLLPWLLDQDQDTVVRFLGYCVAASLNGIVSSEPKAQTDLDRIAGLIDVDPADWWQPTESSYFTRVGKAQIAAVVREVAGEEAAASVEKMKKADAAAAASKLCADSRWLPAALTVNRLTDSR